MSYLTKKEKIEEAGLFILLIVAAIDGLVGIYLFTDPSNPTEIYVIYGIISFIVLFITWICTSEKKKIKVIKKY